MDYLAYLKAKIRHYPLRGLLFDGLARAGIKIRPFYLILGQIPPEGLPRFDHGFDDLQTCFLDAGAMKFLASAPFSNTSEDELLERLRQGKKCFGVKFRDEIIAFMWVSLDECNFKGYGFKLVENEAYLFDTYTFMPFRGRGIACYMIYQCYKKLLETGKTRFYWFSIPFNPSIRIAEKMDGKIMDSGVFVEIFNRWQFKPRVTEERLQTMRKNIAL